MCLSPKNTYSAEFFYLPNYKSTCKITAQATQSTRFSYGCFILAAFCNYLILRCLDLHFSAISKVGNAFA